MRDLVVTLSAGNPGALRVLMELVQSGRADVLVMLYAMELRGLTSGSSTRRTVRTSNSLPRMSNSSSW